MQVLKNKKKRSLCIKIKILTNEEIYLINQKLNSSFEQSKQYLPARINFYIQKNKKIIADLAFVIEESRNAIILEFGSPDEEGKVIIPKDKIQEANKELIDLFSIKQEIDIELIDLEAIENYSFTMDQMEALMFMIEE